MGLIDGYRLRDSRRPIAAFLADGRHHTVVRVSEAPGRGRGVFAESPIAPGERVERAHVIVIPAEEWPQVAASGLYHYCFAFGPDDKDAALALGHGSLFNHDWQPNAIYRKRPEHAAIDFYARRAIAVGEEITITYNGDPDDRSPLWFPVV
jgi:SET domain-containing protein